jgi:hypothetical protein
MNETVEWSVIIILNGDQENKLIAINFSYIYWGKRSKINCFLSAFFKRWHTKASLSYRKFQENNN